MAESVAVDITLFGGPGLHAPFAAVAANFQSPFPSALPRETLDRLCAELLPQRLRQRLALAPGDGAFEHVAAALANALQDLNGPNGLPVQVDSPGDGACRILLGYRDATAATSALRAGLELAVALFSHAAGRPPAAGTVANVVQGMAALMQAYQPDFIARALIRAAGDRGIPVYSVSPGSRVWLYGQGRAGVHFLEAASQYDSLTGSRLSRDKYLSNQFVRRLGFPGVVHGIADSEDAAVKLAQQIGFPVVVKPVDSVMGRGVTARIRTEEQLQRAFAKANAVSRRVIVERHVAGDDHRLAVIGGRFAWGARRTPPRITGDGTHTVAELVDIENRSRSGAAVAAGFDALINVDADVVEMLAGQGIGLHDCPAAGATVLLRSANAGVDGIVTDCTAAVHPDNREMAETIARCFRLDAAGIDFMTADIARSWRETDGAVTEVNAMPGISFQSRADIILRARFPEGDDGRIPCIVLIGGGGALRGRAADALAAAGRRVGQTDASVTLMAGRERRLAGRTLASRVTALLLDTSCEALVVSATAGEIEREGFPLDRCDLVLITDAGQVSPSLRRLLERCAPAVLDVKADSFDGTLALLIGPLLNRRPPRDQGANS